MPDARNKPLRVAGFVATRVSDPERGPQVRLAPVDASDRLLTNGELAWVHGPRRQQLAEETGNAGNAAIAQPEQCGREPDQGTADAGRERREVFHVEELLGDVPRV